MTSSEYRKFINTISEGIYEVLKGKGLIEELTENNQDNPHFFSGNLSKLASKELRWTNDLDFKADVITEAFSNIMLQRDPFKKFIKKGNDGHKSGLEQFLHVMFQRELSKLSQKYIKKLKEVNESNMSGGGDKTPKEQFEHLIDQYDTTLEEKFTPEEEVAFEKILRDLENILRDRESFPKLKLIIDMLLTGFSKTEIAKTLGVSSARVSKYISFIKDALDKLAKKYESKGDSSLLEFLNTYKIKGTFSGVRNPETDVEKIKHQMSVLGIQYINKVA